jgi:hypothetical protein
MKFLKIFGCAAIALSLLAACGKEAEQATTEPSAAPVEQAVEQPAATRNPRFDIYTEVTLNADLSHLNANQKQMLVLLVDAAKIMDKLFWEQAYGSKEDLLKSIESADERKFALINYGPWDRLDGNKPFIGEFSAKPAGAAYYPADITREEFQAWNEVNKANQYSIVQRNTGGDLELVPYSIKWAEELSAAADILRQAADLAEDLEFGNYLRLRADALVTDDYQESDFAWMDMKNNPIELVIGPIENYEDQLFGIRNAFSAYVLIKDLEWSERLQRFAEYMPDLQRNLPVPDAYKREMPGSDADLNAYDIVYYAGDSNAGSKTIAINLPNDEQVQLEKGTRRLQLKNSVRAKFDRILMPIADELIAEDQRQHITFDAFFANVMFHEVAHGLGIKNTINGTGTVRQALRDYATTLEEGKADVLGLYMIQQLRAKGEITEGDLMDNYVTFMAGIFRSVRFGASSAHGKANMIRFNYFQEWGAFTRDPETNRYRVNVEQFEVAVRRLSEMLIKVQGDGIYRVAEALVKNKGVIMPGLQADLDRLAAIGIPVDVVFRQGTGVLGL